MYLAPNVVHAIYFFFTNESAIRFLPPKKAKYLCTACIMYKNWQSKHKDKIKRIYAQLSILLYYIKGGMHIAHFCAKHSSSNILWGETLYQKFKYINLFTTKFLKSFRYAKLFLRVENEIQVGQWCLSGSERVNVESNYFSLNSNEISFWLEYRGMILHV